MKFRVVVFFCALGFWPVTPVAAADAAVEAQEGDVEHWIEYYKKERGYDDEAGASEDNSSKAGSRNDSNPDRSHVPERAPDGDNE